MFENWATLWNETACYDCRRCFHWCSNGHNIFFVVATVTVIVIRPQNVGRPTACVYIISFTPPHASQESLNRLWYLETQDWKRHLMKVEQVKSGVVLWQHSDSLTEERDYRGLNEVVCIPSHPCRVPDDWKVTNLVPLLKKGNQDYPGSFNTVCLVSDGGYLWETILWELFGRE